MDLIIIDNTNYKEVLNDIRSGELTINNFNIQINFKIQNDLLKYRFEDRYLRGLNCYNSSIFGRLQINKVDFCKKVYGYAPFPGGCPETKRDDWRGLVNLVEALFIYIDDNFQNIKPKELNLSSIQVSFIADCKEDESLLRSNKKIKSPKLQQLVDDFDILNF